MSYTQFDCLQKTAIILIILSFILWWSGIAGNALYGIPTLFFLISSSILIVNNRFTVPFLFCFESLSRFTTQKYSQKWIVGFFTVNSIIWLLYGPFQYYSFELFTMDVGIYSNHFFNLSRGELFSSFINVHSYADHFYPSISFIALFYKIVPSALWIMLFKAIAYILCPVVIYLICIEVIDDPRKARNSSIITGLLWLLLYAPAVNSMRFEFTPSSLAPPFVFYAFLCMRKKQWWKFFLCMAILVGFKEHMGAVWIGFGCYLMLARPDRKLGLFLVLSGIIIIYVVNFQIIPYFNEYRPAPRVMPLGPFTDIPEKIIYSVKLLIPLLFIPLVFWKNGIIAGPAIGINLISNYATMYSSHYHYDDVLSSLLLISVMVSLNEIRFTDLIHRVVTKKSGQFLIVLWIVFFLALLPYSNIRFVRKRIPSKTSFAVVEELNKFDKLSKGQRISVQGCLGAHIHRREIQKIRQTENKSCATHNSLYNSSTGIDYFAFAPGLSNFEIPNMKKCLNDLDEASNYQRVSGFKELVVFKHEEK